ncbi:hypothetical protein [Cohnella nanjingensis]|uniref:Uncharacterized protein n=1 Tax=Cohnella nanjingensis TaxID=1387779 RepID=A0A7X0RY14_9BACL|nr:hypothetical protein [Cohnella nanjingensis]MBB6674179.1 hypothetical protein [Cohnella nanjingensis]
MEKRLSRTDLMFALGFLFLLVVAVGAFFYGVKVGSDQANARHEASIKPAGASNVKQSAYSQQDLVSFYHTVFLPYREFMSEWSAARQQWLSDSTVDRSAALTSLSKRAAAKYESAKVAYVSDASPLLASAQDNYLKSLKLFSSSFSKLAGAANDGTAATMFDKLNADAFYKEGVSQQLAAQKQYYAAMLKWGSSVDADVPDTYAIPTVIANSTWKSLPLLVKNIVSAEYMEAGRQSYDFLPQDLTARIDQFIQSGQAEKMKQRSMGSIADMLTGTDAVRGGDFLSLKTRLYNNQTLPQLPFFSPDN